MNSWCGGSDTWFISLYSGHYAADQLCNVLEAIFLHELKDKRGSLWRERQKPNQLDLPEPVRKRERETETEVYRFCCFRSHSGPVWSLWCLMK